MAKGPRSLEPEELDRGPVRCSSRQGGRGRGPRTPAYSCGRERWRYCIALLELSHFAGCSARAPTKSCRRLGPIIRSPCAASPSLALAGCRSAQKLEPKLQNRDSPSLTDHCTTRGLSTRRCRRAIQPASSFGISSCSAQQIQWAQRSRAPDVREPPTRITALHNAGAGLVRRRGRRRDLARFGGRPLPSTTY